MPNIAEACSRVTASGTMAAGPELFLQGSYRGLRIVNPLRVPHLAGYAEQMLSLEVQNIGQWDESLAAQSKTGEPFLAQETPDAFGVPPPTTGEFCRSEKLLLPGLYLVLKCCCHGPHVAPERDVVMPVRLDKARK